MTFPSQATLPGGVKQDIQRTVRPSRLLGLNFNVQQAVATQHLTQDILQQTCYSEIKGIRVRVK